MVTLPAECAASGANGSLLRIPPSNKCWHAKIFISAAISQRKTLRTFYDAASRDDECVSGRNIPLTSRSETRIHIRGAFGDLAKLEGRAARGPYDWLE